MLNCLIKFISPCQDEIFHQRMGLEQVKKYSLYWYHSFLDSVCLTVSFHSFFIFFLSSFIQPSIKEELPCQSGGGGSSNWFSVFLSFPPPPLTDSIIPRRSLPFLPLCCAHFLELLLIHQSVHHQHVSIGKPGRSLYTWKDKG